MDEVRRLGALRDKEANIAKKSLAFEVTKLIHGEEEAQKAQQAAEALFGGSGNLDNVPTVMVSRSEIGGKLLDILAATGIIASKSEGRRLIQQGGLYLGNTKIIDLDISLTPDLLDDNTVLIRKGKKSFHRIIVE